MTLVMYDAIEVANLPDGAQAYAGYVGGNWPTLDAVKAKFGGHAHILPIAVNASEDAECLDVENGDAVPAEAPAWVQRQHARGIHRPCVYASVSAMPLVLAELTAHGVTRADVRLWSAHYGDGEHICGPHSCRWTGVPALDGTQWRNTPGYDESVLLDTFFTAVKPPEPPPVAQLDGYVVWKDTAGTLHSRGVVSTTDGKSWG